jgi:lauroyl/myristoyl acyltransferase
MENTAYLQNVQNLRKNIYKTNFNEIENMGLLGTYLMVSANLLAYLPEFSNDDQYRIIQDIQFHRALSNVDQHYLSLLNEVKIIDKSNILENSRYNSHIFVTYHTGSYRMFIQHLIKEKIPFCLVTEERFKKEQGEVAQKIFREIRENQNEDLEILIAENPRLIFELISRLKNGISVVFYIDGNTGVTEKKLDDNKNLLRINFLSHHIYARQGIALLAYLSKSPLAIAIAKRNKNLSNTIQIKPVPTIGMMKKYNRNDFTKNITQKLYRELENFLKKSPEQWEGWFYIDKFFQMDNVFNEFIKPTEALEFSMPVTLVLDQFAHLSNLDGENCFLITRRNFQIMKITKPLFEVLNFFKEPRQIILNKRLLINNQEIDKEFLIDLIELKFLKEVQ